MTIDTDGTTPCGDRSLAMSPSIAALAKALIAAQTELPKITKDKENPFFKRKYAGLDSVMPAALRALTAHGLGLIQTVGQDSRGGTTLTTMLVHEDGEWLSDTQPLLLVKSDPQGQGSAITYARRYGLMTALGLVADEDDDANAASQPRPPTRTQPVRQPRPAPPSSPELMPTAPANGGPAGINDNQRKAIRASLGELFGSNEQAQCEWMATVMPAALNETATVIHLSPLTSTEASRLITALNQERNNRK